MSQMNTDKGEAPMEKALDRFREKVSACGCFEVETFLHDEECPFRTKLEEIMGEGQKIGAPRPEGGWPGGSVGLPLRLGL